MRPGTLAEYDRVADRVKLHRQGDRRPIVVVEGPSDKRLLLRLFGEDQVVVFVSTTRSNVLVTAELVSEMGLSSIACVVDRDLDDVVGLVELNTPCLVAYDNADLEAMLWNSSTLDDLLDEVGSQHKLETFGGPQRLREVAEDVLRPLQRLRRANALYKWGLSFEDLDLHKRIQLLTLQLNVQSICDRLWSPDLGVEKRVLYETAMSGPDPVCPTTGAFLVRGRDALAIAGVALRRLLGTKNQDETSIEVLSQHLRLGASLRSLEGTAWRRRLKETAGV